MKRYRGQRLAAPQVPLSRNGRIAAKCGMRGWVAGLISTGIFGWASAKRVGTSYVSDYLGFIEPQLLTSSGSAVPGRRKIKHDGYHTLLVVEDGQARAYTRTGRIGRPVYPGIVSATAKLHCRSAILDG